MDRCKSCQNILPRTVDRCPVCGRDTAPEVAPQDSTPTAAPMPRDFLGSVRRGKADQEKRSASASNESTALTQPDTTPTQRSNDFELPALAEQTRSVAAISSRLDAHVSLGAKASHGVRTTAAALIGLCVFAAGTAFGTARDADADLIAMTSTAIPIGAGSGSVTGDIAIENFNPLALVSIIDRGACRGGVDTFGVVLDGGTVAALIFDAEKAETPAIASGDVTVVGDVLGSSQVNNITVLETDTPLANRMRIAIGTQIRSGTGVSVVQRTDGQILLVPATVTGIRARSGEVLSYTLGTEVNEAGEVETTKPERGTLVLDEDGDLVGMIDADGSAIPADRIAESVAQFRAEPTYPGPSC